MDTESHSCEVAAALCTVYEDLLGLEWLTSRAAKAHPAYARWHSLREYVRRFAAPDLEQMDGLVQLAESLLDGVYFVRAIGGDLLSLNVGSLGNYGDEAVRTRLRTALFEPKNYRAAMVELSRAGHHNRYGHRVDATEDPGRADLTVAVPGFDLPLIMECKHVDADTSASRFPKLVNHANKQIKAHARDGYGVAVLDITPRARHLMYQEHPGRSRHYGLPVDVLDAERATAAAMQTDNSAVSGVVFVWNEIQFVDERSRLRIAIRRRARFLAHSAPVRKVPDDLVCFLERDAGGIAFRLRPLSGTQVVDFKEVFRRARDQASAGDAERMTRGSGDRQPR